MKKLYCTLWFIFFLYSAFAQGIAGNWYGNLNVQGTSLPIVFHITQNGQTYSTTMDSPRQGAAGIATDKTTFAGNQLAVEAAKFALKYNGTYLPDSNKINGTFTQGTAQFSLVLTSKPTADAAPVARAQDPKAFPYKQEEVTFINTKAGNQLAGTLTLPATGKVSKVVILLSGSGPQNRNEEILQFNHRPFLVWSHWLTQQGIAVLRYDDRGVGKSTGNFNAATTADFADDAEAAVTYLQTRPDLKGVAIGLIGHSEGGLIAPMVASRNTAVKFIVLLAGPGVSISQLMNKQTEDQARLAGVSEDVIKLNAVTNAKMYAAVKKYKDLPTPAFKEKLTVVLKEGFNKYPPKSLDAVKVDELVNTGIKQASSPWFKYFITMDPAVYLSKVKCPVLALNGTLDMQVNSAANLAGIKASLQKAGNKKHTEVALPNLNHLFQLAKTGSVTEYPQIEETVNPMALQKVSDWIKTL